jgi:hypothetical protein
MRANETDKAKRLGITTAQTKSTNERLRLGNILSYYDSRTKSQYIFFGAGCS